jgi:ribosome-associated protein
MPKKTNPQTLKFKIQGDYIELVKLLKVTGLCDTGGMAKIVIIEELVTVDGKVETRKRCKIRPGQVVGFDGQEVTVE